MALTKYRLGDFLELFNERCGVPDLTVWDISGVNSDKEFLSRPNRPVLIRVIIKMSHRITLLAT